MPSLCHFPGTWKTHPSSCTLFSLSFCSDSFRNHRAFLPKSSFCFTKPHSLFRTSWKLVSIQPLCISFMHFQFSQNHPTNAQRRHGHWQPNALEVTGPPVGDSRRTGNLRSWALGTITKGSLPKLVQKEERHSFPVQDILDCIGLSELLPDPWHEAAPSKTRQQ